MSEFSIISDIKNTNNQAEYEMYLVEECQNYNQKEEIYQQLINDNMYLQEKIKIYLLDELPFDSGNFRIENIKLLVDGMEKSIFIPENINFFWNENSVVIN